MNTTVKEDFTISISGSIAREIQKHYDKSHYSLMVENFFKLMLPKERKEKSAMVSARLRGCAASSGFVNKTDKEIKEMMYQEKYGI